MTTIEEIREITNKGYIDDPVKIAQITDEFATLRMNEIFKCDNPEVQRLFDCIVQLYDFDPSIFDELSYIELLTLINHLELVMEPSIDLSPEQFKRFHISFLKRVVLAAGEYHPTVKLFLATEINAMLHYLEEKHRKSEVPTHKRCIFVDLRELTEDDDQNHDDRKSLTVGDLLHLTTDECNKSWYCWKDIDDYKLRVLTACDLDMRLLLNVFLEAYKEHVVLDDITAKYIPYMIPDLTDYEDYELEE